MTRPSNRRRQANRESRAVAAKVQTGVPAVGVGLALLFAMLGLNVAIGMGVAPAVAALVLLNFWAFGGRGHRRKWWWWATTLCLTALRADP